MLDRGRGGTVEAAVSLDDGAVTGWRVRTDVQPMAVVAELMEAEELLRLHPEFQAAMAKRGITDPELSRSTPGRRVTSATSRGVGAAAGALRRLRPAGAGRQRVGAPGRRRDRAGRPEQAARCCASTTTASCRSRRRAATSTPRPARRCATTSSRSRSPSRRAPGFTVEGRVVRWQRWQLRVGFTPARGPGAAPARLRRRRPVRSILHRASLSEMVVPYGDPSPTHYFKNAFDVGENGIGVPPRRSTRGCDCLGEIRYLDAVRHDCGRRAGARSPTRSACTRRTPACSGSTSTGATATARCGARGGW